MSKRVIISVINNLATDQRVKRTAMTFVELGYEVTLVGRQLPGSLPVYNFPGIAAVRFKLWAQKGALFYAFYNIRLLIYLLFNKADLLYANDLDTLLPNFLLSKMKRIPLIYDSHEYFTGVPELEHNRFAKSVWLRIERFVFPRLKHVITVNNSIAEIYFRLYNRKPEVVRNVPLTNKHKNVNVEEVKSKYGLEHFENIFILQGSGINIHRGAEEAVEAMQTVDAGLLIIGGGDVFSELPGLTERFHVKHKVIIHPKVSQDELKKITSVCFAGLSLDKDNNINYRLSLPNKLFDYIHAGIPVIVSRLAEVEAIVEDYDVGIVLSSNNTKAIASAMVGLLEDEPLYKKLRLNCVGAAEELCWEKEKEKLISVISSAEKTE
ncbi:MAG: glycosyltransferase [Bacteroidetes bacterium]|nr:glycosyltransferase [Bacteroidota bacterium]